MSSVNTLITGLKGNVVSYLGAAYKELDFIYDLTKNKFKGSTNRYGVRPLSAEEVPGVTNHATVDQQFEIILTEPFKTNNLHDNDLESKVITLMDNARLIYKEIDDTKAGSPGVVMNIKNLLINEPEILEEDKVVAIRFQLTITHRWVLG